MDVSEFNENRRFKMKLEERLKSLETLLAAVNKDMMALKFSEGKYNDEMKLLMTELGYGENDSFKLSEVIQKTYQKAKEA